ncbi:hypothetical protein B0H15DRAFT_812788 [Mycena belliarum]|uniref:rRNA biogenesis protein RRP36 n=1 Tax=Mycena belliarum TaxID=1033014 RepID=A0AAD6UMF3_9AGAR|nr:hypothetical protein B0H15DRAFT_812788 [Mycena belliae]
MPRRPRSVSRAPPKESVAKTALRSGVGSKPQRAPFSSPELSEDSSDEEQNQELVNESDSTAEASDVAGEEDNDDVDAPRISQWVDDDDFDPAAYTSDKQALPENNGAGPSQLKLLENDLSNLPLGALLRAQSALTQANASDSGSESPSEAEDTKPQSTSSKGKEKGKPEWSIQPRHDIAKRSGKHAPMEVTSKRPVTRRRTVVEVKTIQQRDPRFLPLAGEFLPQKFQEQYGFLVDSHKSELRTLRENLKTARRRLASSPRDLRAEREAEVGRLEMAVKRAESMVNQDRRAKVDQEALTKLNEAERAKRKEGKKDWWLKESDKKEFLARARYDALAAEGGKRAVKRAIEKKQKKIGQKEKKSRPFAKGNGLKRKSGESEGGPAEKKRRRV